MQLEFGDQNHYEHVDASPSSMERGPTDSATEQSLILTSTIMIQSCCEDKFICLLITDEK